MIHITFVRHVLEYACQLWHTSLPGYPADQIEQIQKPALMIIVLDSSYNESLNTLNLTTLYQRREILCHSFYKNVLERENKLNNLLPTPKEQIVSLKNPKQLYLQNNQM